MPKKFGPTTSQSSLTNYSRITTISLVETKVEVKLHNQISKCPTENLHGWVNYIERDNVKKN